MGTRGWYCLLNLVPMLRVGMFFGRSAASCDPHRDGLTCFTFSVVVSTEVLAAERPKRHSHAERGNE